MKKRFTKVLITGTTTGLGYEFSRYYEAKGCQVIAVNRRHDKELQQRHPKVNFHVLDITNENEINDFLLKLDDEELIPDLFLLNAGINSVDNNDGLNYHVFNQVMQTNLMGVMTFVGAIHRLGIREKTIAALSSTSNIVPNPAHLGYYLSKFAIQECFHYLNSRDPGNCYQYVVLGPVRTEIMGDYPHPTGLQGKIFNALVVEPKPTVEACAEFFTTKKEKLLYPVKAVLFYHVMRFVLKFVPKLYQGTRLKQIPTRVPQNA